jgi:hypothetical protein
MSFQEKRALVSLIAIWIGAVGFAANIWRSPPAAMAHPGAMLFSAAAALTFIMVVSHIGLTIGAGLKAVRQPADDRDRRVQWAARRNGFMILGLGLCATVALAAASIAQVVVVLAVIAAFVLAEMVRYASELLYYRRAR